MHKRCLINLLVSTCINVLALQFSCTVRLLKLAALDTSLCTDVDLIMWLLPFKFVLSFAFFTSLLYKSWKRIWAFAFLKNIKTSRTCKVAIVVFIWKQQSVFFSPVLWFVKTDIVHSFSTENHKDTLFIFYYFYNCVCLLFFFVCFNTMICAFDTLGFKDMLIQLSG